MEYLVLLAKTHPILVNVESCYIGTVTFCLIVFPPGALPKPEEDHKYG